MLGLNSFQCFLFQDGGGNAVPFRYTVSPRAMVNTFEPKAVANDDITDMRASIMGAACAGKFKAFPKSDICSILWEVSWLGMKCTVQIV